MRFRLGLTLDFAVDIGAEFLVVAAMRRGAEDRFCYRLWLTLDNVCRSWRWCFGPNRMEVWFGGSSHFGSDTSMAVVC